MTDTDPFTKAQWALQDGMDRLKAALQARENELMKMPWANLRAIANDAHLAQDLNRSQLAKYIIRLEFRIR